MPKYFDEDGNEVDPFAEPEQQQEQQQERNPLRAQINRLEKQVRDLRKENEAGQKAVRQLEFVKAGVDLTDKRVQWFVKGYDGDLNAEAIKAAYEADFGEAPGEPQGTDIPAEEQAAHQRMAAATAGTTAPGARDFDAEIRAAGLTGKPEDVDRIYAEKMAAAGHTGPAVLDE